MRRLVSLLLLVLGLGTRWVSLLFVAVMLGAVTVGGHWQHGFFMNWFGAQAGEGFEYHLLLAGLSGALALQGAGALSLDALLSQVQARAPVQGHVDPQADGQARLRVPAPRGSERRRGGR